LKENLSRNTEVIVRNKVARFCCSRCSNDVYVLTGRDNADILTAVILLLVTKLRPIGSSNWYKIAVRWPVCPAL